MEREKLLSYILDSMTYPLVFIDTEGIIRYMNKEAEFRLYVCRGFRNLIGQRAETALYTEEEKVEIPKIVESFKKHGPEVFAGVTERNRRKYYVPVRDKQGNYIGYYERLELNVEK